MTGCKPRYRQLFSPFKGITMYTGASLAIASLAADATQYPAFVSCDGAGRGAEIT